MRNALSAVAVLFVIALVAGCSSSSGQGSSGSVEGSRFTFVWPAGYSYDSPSNALTGPSTKLQSSAPAYVTGATVTFSQPGITPVTLDIPLGTGVVNFVVAPGTYTIDVVVTTNIDLTFTATQTTDLAPGFNDLTFNLNVNAPPTITSVTASSTSPTVGDTVKLTCSATDLDPDDTLTYSWSGAATGSGQSISYHVSGAGSATFTCQVSDGHGGTDTGSVTIRSNAPTPVAPACVGDFTVDTTNDTVDANPGDGTCADAGGNCTLRSAIDEANALAGAQTICVPAGTYTNTGAAGDDNNVSGDLDITDDLTITGAGAGTTIIDGGGIDRVLHIPGAVTVNITGVTIQNGSASNGDGGGIYNNSGIVTVTNSTISNNTTNSWKGGGIYNNTGTVNVTNSTISGNGGTSNVKGGGVCNWTGGIMNITNSIISNNTANNEGGGVYNWAGTMKITNSTISSNTAPWGGGIENDDGNISTDPADLTITNSTIKNNTATDSGGGIYNYTWGAGSQPPTVDINNSTISGNTAVNNGGGIFNEGNTGNTAVVNITNSTISGNTADFGGGIKNLGTGTATALIINTTITNNTAPGMQGGGIWTDGAVDMSNTIVANQQPAAGEDCIGAINDNANNLDSDGTCLGATGPTITLGLLQDNGGPTQTHALQAGSPAINLGNAGICPTTDQRGYNRPDVCDIGAYEFNGFP